MKKSASPSSDPRSWFSEARLGMFIHWGVYAQEGRGEWRMASERVSCEAYRRQAAGFGPSRFDPAEWARVAREGGARYAVLTAKHHDGYALFRTAQSDFGSCLTGEGAARAAALGPHAVSGSWCWKKDAEARDYVAEYVEAFRREGLKVGLYYSLIDWMHPDFPAKGDLHHPLRDDPAAKGPEDCDLAAYRRFMLAQLRELLTQYGKIDLIWFDFSYPGHGPDFWGAKEIIELTRRLQPEIVINSRLEGSGEDFATALSATPSPYAGDFLNPEMILPPAPLVRYDGSLQPWEACVTMDNNWGYCPQDPDRKDPALLWRILVEAVAKGGNVLLNVSPTAEGELPAWQVARWQTLGRWLRANGAAIYGAGPAPLPKPDWGFYTERDGHLYAHVLLEPFGPIPFKGLKGKVGDVKRLADGYRLRIVEPWSTKMFAEDLFVNWARPEHYHFCRQQDDTPLVLELFPHA